MPKPKYKAVIFDFDDTLVETCLIKLAQYQYVAKKVYNTELTEEAFLRHWGKPFRIMLAGLFENIDTFENIHAAVRAERTNFFKKVYKGSVDTVNNLLNKGVKVGILSATNTINLLEDLERLDFPIERLTIIQSSDETKVHKPDPKVFLPILRKLKKEGVKKEKTVYVGDSLDDLQAAKGAGGQRACRHFRARPPLA